MDDNDERVVFELRVAILPILPAVVVTLTLALAVWLVTS